MPVETPERDGRRSSQIALRKLLTAEIAERTHEIAKNNVYEVAKNKSSGELGRTRRALRLKALEGVPFPLWLQRSAPLAGCHSFRIFQHEFQHLLRNRSAPHGRE